MNEGPQIERNIPVWPAYALVLLALILRVAEYARNKALWLDEAHLALNFLRRDYAGLLDRLDYDQGAPLVFLWIERFVFAHFGGSEYALRALPLLASLVSCWLAYAFLRRVLPHSGFHVALAIFALSIPAIRYASEVKAYASDLLIALALLLLLLPALRRGLSPARFVVLAIAGAASVWCAFPAIFVLAGIGTLLFARAVRERDWPRTAAYVALGAAWCASFALDYWLLLRHNSGNTELRTWWMSRFMPLPPRSLPDLNWFIRTFFEVFQDPVGLPAAGLGALLFVLGALSLARRDRALLLFLLLPFGVALAASGLHQYPIMGRFLLFALPILVTIIGEGWDYLSRALRPRIALAVVAVVLFIQPVAAAASGLVKAPADGVRPAYRHVVKNWQEGDILYVHHWAYPAFACYAIAENRTLPIIEGITSRADWSLYKQEFVGLRGNNRVWIVTTNTPPQLTGQDEKYFETCLNEIGACEDVQRFAESSVYLYNLARQK